MERKTMKRIPLKMQLLAAEQELKDFSALLDLQHKRSVEAIKLWQNDTGEQYNPDLGELLRYFIAQRDLLDKFYWLLREGRYASDEYADAMEQYERREFCRSNADLRHGSRERTLTQQKYIKPPQENQQVSGLPLSTSDLFCKSFSIRRDVLDLTMAQWEIADSLDLTSITPRDWIRAIGARGGFLTALLTDEEREFVRIVYLPNTKCHRPE